MDHSDEALARLAQELGRALSRRGWTVTAAESCTGGWLCKLITDVAGSSGWFERGFVTYSNDAKRELLGVGADTLAEDGAVSEAAVRQMAAGALQRSAADLAVAVSGIAGPGGGSAEKPVGTVWLAWARQGGEAVAAHGVFSGDREAVRRAALRKALSGLLEMTEKSF